MALHECPYSFDQLAAKVLPELYCQLVGNLHNAKSVEALVSTSTALPRVQACYVFADDQRAIYVGITKDLARRVNDHLVDDPSRANLALRIAAKKLALPLRAAKLNADFPEVFSNARRYLSCCRLGWIPVPDAMSLYLLEPYAAMKLDTSDFNKFDTLQILSPRTQRDMGTRQRSGPLLEGVARRAMPVFEGKGGLKSGIDGLSTCSMQAADQSIS